jgi:superfamily I DNA/RNA helicase
MHRVKGLEFDHVILCGINKGTVPLPTPDLISDDVSVREMAEARERSLLFVAATRAKKTVMVTSYGEKSPYL